MAKKRKKRDWTFTLTRRQRAMAMGAVAAVIAVAGIVAIVSQREAAPRRADRVPEPAVRVALPPVARPALPLPLAEPPVSVAQTAAVVLPPPKPVPAPVLPAWRKFAVAPPPFDGRPLIAIVIDDLGVDRKRSMRTTALPGPLTLAWLPYASDVTAQASAARAAGHEILLHAPMQPQGAEYPGPRALTVDLPDEEIARRVAGYLALLPEAVGLNNHMGSRFTRDARAMAPVLAELKSRGLLFLDSRTAQNSIAADLARDAGIPYAVRDVFLDNEATADRVRAQLANLEATARLRGAAVGIGHPHDGTLDALEPWLRGLAARGFVLAPISAVVRWRAEHPALASRG
jgi:polysaccharide deacetylase 2 family uncharacterized protein YibQ